MVATYFAPAIRSVGAGPQCSVLGPLLYLTPVVEMEGKRVLGIEYLGLVAPELETYKLWGTAKDWHDLRRYMVLVPWN